MEPSSGFDMTMEILSAAIGKNEIEFMVRVSGIVERPEAAATVHGIVIPLHVPAKITSNEETLDG